MKGDWPEFEWARERWPGLLPLPGRERVMALAYRTIGLDYSRPKDRSRVKTSRTTYKPLLVCAASPALVGLLGCSGLEASQVMGLSRHLTRADHLVTLLGSPAAQALGGLVLSALIAEQRSNYADPGRPRPRNSKGGAA